MNMKIFSLCVVAIFLITSCQQKPVQPEAPKAEVSRLEAVKPDLGRVIFLAPQWHLSPGTKTNPPPAQSLPQQENQFDIYRQISTKVEDKAIQHVVVEGCEGEIKTGFSENFNGWTLSDLEAMKKQARSIDEVMTHVGLKLEAQFGSRLLVACGDSRDLIQRHQMALSDIRGLWGFKIRIDQFKDNPEKKAGYIAALKKVLRIPYATEKEAMVRLNENLREKFATFKQMISDRNDKFVETVARSPKSTAVVIGALHIEDLRKKFEARNEKVEVLAIKGLRGDEERFIEEVEKQILR